MYGKWKWNRAALSILMVLFLLTTFVPVGYIPNATAASDGVERVFTDKSRYSPGNTVTITATISNDSGSSWNGNVELDIYHLEAIVYSTSQAKTINNGVTTDVTFTWTAPATDYRGYFVQINADTLGTGATAIDVSSEFIKYPRYGYISEFDANETAVESAAKVDELAEDYHINAWQFYDWMWRHDKMFKRTDGTIDATWLDLFSREISWQTIQNQIGAVHDQNGMAMAYAMIYASRENYTSFGLDAAWGLYEDASHSNQFDVDFGDGSTYLYLFDPQNTSWQNYIFNEYMDAIDTAQFDGIHVDQMGQRSNVYTYDGSSVDLSTRFTPFLNQAKSTLTTNNSNSDYLTYNIVDGTVDGWAANDVSTNADLDFLYSEIWHLSNGYIQLQDYIEAIRSNSGNKAVVLAAYMNYAENIGPRYEAESATLTNVAIDTDHAGYTGTGFVDEFASIGDSVEFTITAPEDGQYSLVFRYANATGADSRLNMYVDNVFEQELFFFEQANWDTWKEDATYTMDLTQGSHTIKLAYESGNVGAINLDSLTLGTFDDHSVRLADAMMAASGATHIELGEDSQMLAHEYYPNRSKSMRNSLKSAMKDHYNFITAYENLLFDSDVVLNDRGAQFVDITGVDTSGDALANTVWHITKRTPDYNIVHLINLLNNDNQWRNSGVQPTFQTNLATKFYIGNDETITDVYVASPDLDGGLTEELSFTSGSDSKGKYVSFTIPELQYWDMIYMARTFSDPVNSIYEAESAIKTNVSTNTNHTGYTGSGFVDEFATTNDGVSYVVHADTDDDYALRFRYSNGGSDATRDVYVDGQYAGTIGFDHTGAWNSWDYGELTVHLDEGYHTVVLWYSSGNSNAINLDHLDMDKTYIWSFDVPITSIPANYRITFRTGMQGWVHWGTNNWTNVTDTMMRSNGSSNNDQDYEISVGPFSSGTIDFTFLWDDNNNGVAEYGTDRWEGTDFEIVVN